GLDLVHLGDGQGHLAALAAPGLQHGGADPVLLAQSFVQLEQVGGEFGGDGGAAGPDVARLLVDLGEGGVAAGLGLGQGGQGLVAAGDEVGDAGVGRLAAFHDLQHHLFQVALPLVERGDLGLEAGQVTGGGDGAGVEALLVALDADADGVDVCFGLGLLAGEVAGLGLGLDDLGGVPGVAFGLLVDLRELGQGAAAVGQPVECGVELGEVEEPLLDLGGCFHDLYPLVQASVTVAETRVSTLTPLPVRVDAAVSSQGPSVAQWAASIRAGPLASMNSLEGRWRRSAVRNTSTPAARAVFSSESPALPLDARRAAVRDTGRDRSPATRMPQAVAGSPAAAWAANSPSVISSGSRPMRPRPRHGSSGNGRSGTRSPVSPTARASASETPGLATSALVWA